MPYFSTTPTNRLKAPKIKRLSDDVSGSVLTVYGGPVAQIGDYVLSTPGVSAGTVGRVTSMQDLGSVLNPGFINGPKIHWACDYEGLDGERHGMWRWTLIVIPYSAVQEVKDFYIRAGRPNRIKVEW